MIMSNKPQDFGHCLQLPPSPGWLLVKRTSRVLGRSVALCIQVIAQYDSASVRGPLRDHGEFKVVTNNYSAEDGRVIGAVVNASTRSGTAIEAQTDHPASDQHELRRTFDLSRPVSKPVPAIIPIRIVNYNHVQ